MAVIPGVRECSVFDLDALARHFREQAEKDSRIILDSTVFSPDVLGGIRVAFALDVSASLVIVGVHADDIPDPVNNVLMISAGTAPVLHQQGVSIGLVFTGHGDSFEAIITGKMSASWKFSDSFRGLNIFPFQELGISKACFVYTTAKQTDYEWPDDPSCAIQLACGLNFLSNLTLDKLSVIKALFGIGTTPFKFYGPFTPASGQPLPVGTITAPLNRSFQIGVPPYTLDLGSAAIAVRLGTSDTDNPFQSVDLLIKADFRKILRCSISIPMSGGTLKITTRPLLNGSTLDELIKKLPGGGDFIDRIPQELSGIFRHVGLGNFTMIFTLTPSVTFIGLSISSTEPWIIISDVLELTNVNLRIEIDDPSNSKPTQVFIAAKANFFPHIFADEFHFITRLQKHKRLNSWEISTVSGSYYGAVSLGHIISGLLGTSDSVPEDLRDIKFSDFGINVTRNAPGSPYTYSFYGNAEVAFPILDRELTAYLTLAVTKTTTSHIILLTGLLIICDEAFTFTLDLNTQRSRGNATTPQLQ
jgi:hypothetical protein